LEIGSASAERAISVLFDIKYFIFIAKWGTNWAVVRNMCIVNVAILFQSHMGGRVRKEGAV